MPTLALPRVDDPASFTADPADPFWAALPEHVLQRVGAGPLQYPTTGRLAWSETGLYVLVHCVDERLTCTLQEDFADLFLEDVVEFFVQPVREQPLYFEYELSPLDYELPILVPNHRGDFHGWLPWKYSGARRVRHAVHVHGGPQAPGAAVSAWSAAFCIPFALLRESGGGAPQPGDRWHANLYRLDYDSGAASHWALFPATGTNYHDYTHFGELLFS